MLLVIENVESRYGNWLRNLSAILLILLVSLMAVNLVAKATTTHPDRH
jgi:hypothetical protein